MDNRSDRVVPLNQLEDFRVAEGDPDVRGWNVLTADGQRIGEVDELLIDTDAMKVRYLDVDVDDTMRSASDRHILIPIGYARLDEDSDQIFVDSLTSISLRQLPGYEPGTLTTEYEGRVQTHFDAEVQKLRRDTGTTTPPTSTGLDEGMVGSSRTFDSDRMTTGTSPLEGRSGEIDFHDDRERDSSRRIEDF